MTARSNSVRTAIVVASTCAIAVSLAVSASRAADPPAYWLVPDDTAGIDRVGVRVLQGDGAPRSEATGGPAVTLRHLTRSGRTSWTAAPGALQIRATPGVHLVALTAPPDGNGTIRFAKALFVVPPAADAGALHRSETGQTLELVPQDDPLLLLRPGITPLQVQVLFDREPLEAADVVAVAGDRVVRARTDDLGLVELVLDRPGAWSLRVAHRGACIDCAHPGSRLWISTLTLRTGPR